MCGYLLHTVGLFIGTFSVDLDFSTLTRLLGW